MIRKFFKKWYIKWLLRLSTLAFIALLGLFLSVYFGYWGALPNQKELSNLSQMQASLVLDKNDVVIGKFYIANRAAVKFDNLPKSLIHALVSTEDVRFYEHNGIDFRSLFRVFFKTILLRDKSSGGGSTLTMQLAKNVYGRKDYGRFGIVINKMKEAVIAHRIEKIYTKNEILTMYLNTVPFSGNTYGIESAAQKFFNKPTKDLTIAEAATLVGTLKANHYYNPRLFPIHAKNRRNVVLEQMEKYNYLSNEAEKSISKSPLKLDYDDHQERLNLAAYFKEQVRQKANEILSKEQYKKKDGSKYNLMTDGLRIYTTLDARLQEYAEASMQENMKKLQKTVEKAYKQKAPWRNKKLLFNVAKNLTVYKQYEQQSLNKNQIFDSLNKKENRNVFSWKGDTIINISLLDSIQQMLKFFNTGFIAIDPHSGAIKAYIGGINYDFFHYDHVVQSKRQVGSTFKPFVYTSAIENGMKPCKYFSIQAVTYKDQEGWKPQNAESEDEKYMNYSLERALSLSVNTIAVKVLRESGIQNTIDQVHKMGIREEIEKVPSIALGISAIRLIDMAKAYSCYLNNGRPVSPYFIDRIEDRNGKLIYQAKKTKSYPKAFSEYTRAVMLEMLKDVVNNGTARRLRTRYHFTNDLAGKTGTTQNNADGWFVGLLPNLVTVTWVGNDNQTIKFRTTRVGQGANSALPIFAGFLRRMNANSHYEKYTKKHFKLPSDEVLNALDCPPEKKDGLFKRIFSKKNKKVDFKKKEGFFHKLFNKKDHK